MSSIGLEAYLQRLGEELRRRSLDVEPLLTEAREHLVDLIEDGVRRGLSRDEADQQAFAAFGSPEMIAESSAAERDHMSKWWILVPTIASAIVAVAVSYYLLPVRYQSEAFLEFIRVSADRVPGQAKNELKGMSDEITSRTRLERIIEDLNLYEDERRTEPIDAVVNQMRQDISIVAMADGQGADTQAFTVRFRAEDPQVAQRGTARLASLFIDEHVTGHMGRAAGAGRQSGDQLKIVDPARLPERPVGLSHAQVGAIGGCSGLVLGLALVGATSVRRRTASL